MGIHGTGMAGTNFALDSPSFYAVNTRRRDFLCNKKVCYAPGDMLKYIFLKKGEK